MTQELQFSSVYGLPRKHRPVPQWAKAYQMEPAFSSEAVPATTDFSRLLNITHGDVYRPSHHSMVRVSRNQASLGTKSALSRLNLTEIQANNQSTAMTEYFDRQSQTTSVNHQASRHSSGKHGSLLVSAKGSQRQP